ncbi:hypothetical protein BV25DRAFT_1920365 [Artomyces pyxidatus]|uniref:Uncharacterized protein n=1 Tax=Artomyces pyxidatus TaxID=48021 RepID=A0ACB8SL13_9AGAM|nr:hypothetical protein BV25DRAFT_1920365 [Artomyces pyxidatus]
MDVCSGEFILETTASRANMQDAMGHNDELYMSSNIQLVAEPDTTWVLHLDGRYGGERERPEVGGTAAPHRDWLIQYTVRWSGTKPGFPSRTAICVGQPDGNSLLGFVQLSIGDIGRAAVKSLPDFMLISMELATYMRDLEPFLHSLPDSVAWMLEPPAIGRIMDSGEQPCDWFMCYMELAAHANGTGNTFFRQKSYREALIAYGEAIRHCVDSTRCSMSILNQKILRSVLPVALVNRGNALLMGTAYTDPEQAAIDGRAAEKVAPYYYKAYVCQWEAHQVLGDQEQAWQAVKRAVGIFGQDAMEDITGTSF